MTETYLVREIHLAEVVHLAHVRKLEDLLELLPADPHSSNATSSVLGNDLRHGSTQPPVTKMTSAPPFVAPESHLSPERWGGC